MSYKQSGRMKSGYEANKYSEHDDRKTGSEGFNYSRLGGRGRGRSSNRGRYMRSDTRSQSTSSGSFARGGKYQPRRGNRSSHRRPFSRGRNFPNRKYINPDANTDNDGDVNMQGEGEGSGRYNPYARPHRRARFVRRDDNPSQSWHKIIIIHGALYDEKWLREEISKNAFVEYQPVQYHLDGNNSAFFLDDYSTGESIRNCSKKIVAPDGTKLTIYLKPAKDAPLQENDITLLKEVLSERYNSTTKHLSLSSLFFDDKLKNQNVKIKVSSPVHMYIVTKIIAENISTLTSLDMTDSGLFNLDGVKHLVQHTPCIKRLNLSKNKISRMKELEKIQGWDLSDLTLDQNPLCAEYKSKADYIRDIRECFPNLQILDSHPLPAPVKFDVDKTRLPTSVPDFMPTTGQDIIKQFIQQFFKCYDESRSQLSEAYHENCIFTLSLPQSPRGPALSHYFSVSRNLKRIKDTAKKISTVTTSRNDVISLLVKLNGTTHYFSSFSVDVPLITSTVVNFIVRGVFKENGSNGVLRSFSRNFFCQISNTSLQIVNEQYFLRNPTSDELREAKTYASKQKSSSNVSQQSEIHVEMISSFAKESGMNLSFSEQCLKENSWNYEEAGKVFLMLKEQGKIPLEAFGK